jgi:hypothetical protein
MHLLSNRHQPLTTSIYASLQAGATVGDVNMSALKNKLAASKL